MSTKKLYFFIYHLMKQKHPDWSPGRLRSCTIYAVRRNKK